MINNRTYLPYHNYTENHRNEPSLSGGGCRAASVPALSSLCISRICGSPLSYHSPLVPLITLYKFLIHPQAWPFIQKKTIQLKLNNIQKRNILCSLNAVQVIILKNLIVQKAIPTFILFLLLSSD